MAENPDIEALIAGYRRLTPAQYTRLQERVIERAKDLRAEHLRNNLAHSQHDIVKGSSWKKTIQLVERVEVVVLASDERVEKKAMSSANRGKRGLWASA